MTVIAWDGKTLAADKAGTIVGYAHTVTKVFRVPGGMVAFAGNGAAVWALLEWFRGGRKLAEYPESQKDEDKSASALFVDDQRQVRTYGRLPYPELVEDRFYAMGSGRDYALAAMYLGHDARKAVEVACELDNDCGRGIDALSIE